jgi:hypothetical protein
LATFFLATFLLAGAFFLAAFFLTATYSSVRGGNFYGYSCTKYEILST